MRSWGVWLVIGYVRAAADCRLMRVDAGRAEATNAVDLYNSASSSWSTAQLSAARYNLAATSVGNVAFFAGGSVSVYNAGGSVSGNSSFCVLCRRVAVGLVVVGDA